MSSNSNVSVGSNGVGFTGLLFLTSVILGVLKVAGVLSLTWFQVFIPTLIAVGLLVAVVVLAALVAFALVLFRR